MILRDNPLFFVLAVLALAGCTAPTTVKKYAGISKKAGETFSAVHEDLYRSCVRRQYYEGLSVTFPDLDSLETEAVASCADFKRAGRGLKAANKTLVDYLKTLSKLADKNIVVYDDEFDDFADALEDTYPFDDRRIEAVGSVTSFVAEAAAGAWRRRNLGKAIERTNDDIQVIAAMFEQVLSTDYKRLLEGEREAARKYYLGKVKLEGRGDPLSAVVVYDLWRKEDAAIDEKQDGAGACAGIYRRIAKGHQKLFDNREDLDSKEMRKFAVEYTETIEELIAEVTSAF
jgi:hypothetical protein